MKRMAIAGSAVNPPHLGHELFARSLKESGRVDRVYWFPTGDRQDKPGLRPGPDRRRLSELGFGHLVDDRFVLDLSEVTGHMVCTIDRLERMQREYPDVQMVWSTAVDVLVPQRRFGMESEVAAKWHRGEELLSLWPCIVAPRVGYTHPSELGLPSNFEILGIDLPAHDISSTQINLLIENGLPWKHLVLPQVAAYLEEHNQLDT